VSVGISAICLWERWLYCLSVGTLVLHSVCRNACYIACLWERLFYILFVGTLITWPVCGNAWKSLPALQLLIQSVCGNSCSTTRQSKCILYSLSVGTHIRHSGLDSVVVSVEMLFLHSVFETQGVLGLFLD
jgi:hypothetical protein